MQRLKELQSLQEKLSAVSNPNPYANSPYVQPIQQQHIHSPYMSAAFRPPNPIIPQ